MIGKLVSGPEPSPESQSLWQAVLISVCRRCPLRFEERWLIAQDPRFLVEGFRDDGVGREVNLGVAREAKFWCAKRQKEDLMWRPQLCKGKVADLLAH